MGMVLYRDDCIVSAVFPCLSLCGEKFHVLTLVDGDHVRIRSAEHPERFFDLDFMEIACVPADMGRYVVENLGKEPIRVHKTMLRDGYENDPA
jgi:hypothetical protein